MTSRLTPAYFVVGVAAVAAGGLVLAWPALPPPAESDPGSTVTTTSLAVTLPPYIVEPVTRLKALPAEPSPYAGPPNRVIVPSLGIDVPVISIPLYGGTLQPPSDPQTLGWWQDGAEPGALTGTALITGHTVHTGGGALDNLERMRRGDEVKVRTDLGTISYTVSGVSIFRKASLADHAGEVFSQGVPGRVVLVTCEDWNGEKYLSNVVVFADPTSTTF